MVLEIPAGFGIPLVNMATKLFPEDTMEALAAELGSGGGSSNVTMLFVATGNEARPEAEHVIWIGGLEKPTNMTAADIHFKSGTVIPTDPTGEPPVITTTALTAMKVGVPFQQIIEYTGDDATAASVTAGALPPGLEVVRVGAVVRIQGTPTAAQGTSVGITIANAAGSDFKAFGLSVAPADPEPVSGHSVFGTTVPPETLTFYQDSSDQVSAQAFYTYGSPAYEGLELVAIKVYVPANTPAGILSAGGWVSAAPAHAFRPADSPNLVELEAILRNPANRTAFSTLQVGWNTIPLAAPVAWGHGMQHFVAIRFAAGTGYIHSPYPGDAFTTSVEQDFRLVRSDNKGPEYQRGASFAQNEDTWSGALFGLDVVIA